MIRKILALAILAGCFNSCTVLKEYEKVSVNDPEMELGDKICDRYITTFHSYREGAAGANGGKTGGGCGCN